MPEELWGSQYFDLVGGNTIKTVYILKKKIFKQLKWSQIELQITEDAAFLIEGP